LVKPLTTLILLTSGTLAFLTLGPTDHATAHEIKAPTPAVSTAYLVKRGETLSSISKKLKVNSADLAARNKVVGDRIYAGTTLFTDIPAPSQNRMPLSPAGYIVQPGDTLNLIARRLNLNPVALAARNGLVNGGVYAGAQLLTNVSVAGRGPVPAAAFVAKRTGTTAPPVCPVQGHSQFMNDWGFPRPGGRWHRGNDLMAPRGRAVLAPVSGKVNQSSNKLGGKTVHLRAVDGTVYYFAHLDAYGAKGTVSAGAVLGSVGSSGDAEGGPPHLHFEIRPGGGQPVNPYPTVRSICR
jgi:murein DD-endopeptidase MepM/ murein hydrolase activator NlpD